MGSYKEENEALLCRSCISGTVDARWIPARTCKLKIYRALGAGWEQVRKLKDLPIHEGKVSLQELFEFHLERKNICGTEKRGQKSAWNFFRKTIGKTCISEVSEVDIANFYKKTCSEPKKRKSVTNENLWVRTKFTKIKMVLNTCKRYLIPQNTDVERVIRYWERHIELPNTEVSDKPRAITKAAFSKLAKISNLKYQTIYYLAVNCFYYAGDFPYLTKDCIFQKGGKTYIRMPRNKEQRRFERLNCLASETERLLAEYIKSEPNNTEFVFNGEKSNRTPNGRPISAKGIRIHHKKLCEEIGLCGVVTVHAFYQLLSFALSGLKPETMLTRGHVLHRGLVKNPCLTAGAISNGAMYHTLLKYRFGQLIAGWKSSYNRAPGHYFWRRAAASVQSNYHLAVFRQLLYNR